MSIWGAICNKQPSAGINIRPTTVNFPIFVKESLHAGTKSLRTAWALTWLDSISNPRLVKDKVLTRVGAKLAKFSDI